MFSACQNFLFNAGKYSMVWTRDTLRLHLLIAAFELLPLDGYCN